MRTQLKDPHPTRGVFEGDLAYGRAFGNNPDKRKDYAADRVDGVAQNKPIAPLVLVAPRDPELWRRDKRVVKAKRTLDNSQHGVNQMIKSYYEMLDYMKANIHLTVGKTRL